MATEADVPEPISATQRVGEHICLASGLSDKAVHETTPGELNKFQETLNLPHETGKCQAEQETMEAAHNIGAETMNSVIKGNVENPEGKRFLESPSAAVLATEETCTTSKHCQADEESVQDKKEMSENKRQMQNDATNGMSEETGSGEKKVVEDLEEKEKTNDRNCDIVHLTGTGLQAAKIEELNLGITGEGSLEKESYIDQHVEVIEDQQDSAEHKSAKEETGDMQKNEQDADTSLEPNKRVSNTTGVTLDQNNEAPIHVPDPRVSLNKDIEIAAEPCNEAETIKAKSTGEEIGKTSSVVDDKEAEKSTNLVGEEESSQATRLSEGEDNKQDEKEKSMNYSAGDILESSLATYPDIQSEEESMSKVRDINKELLHKSSVTPAEDESSVHEAGPETGEKLKEVSSISCEEENNNNIESSEKMDQTVPVEDEMNNKNNIDTPFAVKTEETSLQRLENPELLKVVPRSWSDDIIKESPNEDREKIEKTAEGDTTSNENCKDNENPEQEEESSFMKHEGTSSIIEVLRATEISSGENRDEGGSTIVGTEDNTDDTKITAGLEHNQSGKSNCEERPDNLQQNEPEIEKPDASLSTVAQDFSTAASNKNFETTTCDDKDAHIKSREESIVESIIDASQQSQSGTSNNEERPEKLQQNEPEKEKLDGSLSLVNADLGTTASTEYVESIPCAQEEAPIKSHEESFAEKIEEDIQTHSGPITETEIPEDKNVPAIEMIDDSEVHVPNKDANDLQVTCPLTEAAIQIESKELDVISDFEPKGQTHEAYKASTEQKHIEDASDASQSSNCTISEHKSTERETAEPIPTSGTDMTKLQESCGLDSEENSMINDSSESKDQEMKTNEESCHTVTHEILEKGDDAGKDINNAEASVEDNRAISVTDEVVEQEFHIESSLAAPTLSGEDETYKPEDNAKMNNITNQQVHDGTNIVGREAAANEQVTESSVAYNSQESTEQETVKSPQLITKEAEKSEGENNSEGIIEDDNTGGLVPVQAEQDPIKNLNNERKKAEESIGEVNWTVDRTATEASPEEKRNEDINSYHNELLKANDNIGKKPSESEEDLQYMLQKKKSGEKLEESLPVVSNDTQIFSSSADKIPCLIKEGAPPNLEETAQKEERVNEEEENNDTKDNKIAMEEDLKLVAETSESSTESIVFEPKSKRDIMVVKDVTEKGESEQDLKLVTKTSEASTESIVLKPKLEKDIMVVEDDTKTEESEQDFKVVVKTSEASTKSIVLEPKSKRDINHIMVAEDDTKKGEFEQDLKLVAETSEASTEGIVLEPKLERDIMVVEDDTKKGESEQDLKLGAKTSEASTESIILEPKSERDIMVVKEDTKKGEFGQDLKLVEETLEATTKSIVLEPNLERDIMVVDDVTKKGESKQDLKLVAKTSKASTESMVLEPKLEKDITVLEDDTKNGKSEQDLKLVTETSEASIEGIVLEPKSESDIMVVEDDTNKRESKQDLKLVTKTSEATTQSIVLEPKSERDIMSVKADTKGESGELYKDSNTDGKDEDIEKQNTIEECVTTHMLPEDVGEKSPNSSKEDQNEKDRPKTEVYAEPDLTSTSEDAGRQLIEKENTVEQCKELEVKKTVQSSEEDDTTVKMPKQDSDTYISVESIELETVESSQGNINKAKMLEAENRREQIIEGGLIPESIEKSPTENLNDEKQKTKDSTEAILYNSETTKAFESIAHETSKTTESQEEILDTSPETTQKSTREILENSETVKTVENIVHETSKTTGSPEEILNTSPDTTQKSAREILENFETVKAVESTTHETSKTTESQEEILDTSLEKTQKSTGEILKNFKTVEAAESIEHETSKTIENPEEILDTSPKKTQKSTEEILENSETTKAVESIAHETSKTTESPEEILDTSLETTQKSTGEILENFEIVKADESIAHETSKTIESLEEILDTALEKTQKSTRDILENFETVKTVESITHETSKTTESPKEILDTSLEKTQKSTSKTTENLEEILDTSLEKTQKSTGEILENFETIKVVESIAHETNKTIESPEEILDTSLENTQIPTGEILENSEIVKTVESIAHETSKTIKSSEEILDTSQKKIQKSTQEILENSKTAKTVESTAYETSKTTESSAEILDTSPEKTQKPTGEILENFETAKAVESIAHETSKTIGSPKEILDTSPVKQEDSFLDEGKRIEASLEVKNEDLSPVMVAEDKNSTTNELFDAKEDTTKKSLKIEADLEHILQTQEPGASKHLEETAKTKEKTEENNEARHDKVATEEKLEVVSKTSDASKSIESIVLQPNLEMDKIVVDDNTRKGESEEVHVEPETTSTCKDAEKQIMIEENIVKQGRVLEVEKLIQSLEEDDKIANMSKQGAEPIEQETVKSSKCITNNAEDLEVDNNEEIAVNSNIKDLIPESIGQDPVENLNDRKMKANKSSGEIFEISKTAEAAENIAHETIDTLDIVDTSLEKKRDDLQNEGNNPAPTEASPEEKDEDGSPAMVTQENTSVNELLDAKENIEKNPSKTEEDLEHISQKNELGEKLDRSLSKEEDETEAFSSNADKIPQLMEEGASQNEEAARNEEIEKNNDDNKVAAEEDLKVVAQTSEASKNKESIALETKSENDKMVDEDDMKNREYEELSEDTKDASKGEDNEKQSIVETCHNTSILPEPVEEKAPESFAEEEKEEETPKIEIFENSETTRAAESVAQETSEMTESPKELHDTSPVEQEENLHSEVKTTEASLEEQKNEDISPVMMVDENSHANELVNAEDSTEKKSSKSEEDLAHILQKNEAGENLEQSLSMTSDEIEILSSNADKTPRSMVEGAPQNLEETAQIEDKMEENHEEDLKVVVKTPEASKSIESTLSEHDSKLDKLVVEDDTKKAESEEVHVEPDSTAMGEDVEKHITKEESTIERCRVLDAENIEQNSEEDDKAAKMSKQGNVTYTYVESVEQETVENSQGNANTAENSEAQYKNEYTMEDGNTRGLIPEPVEQYPVKNLNDEKTEAEKPSGEILEISKTAEAVESERDNSTPIEVSQEEKDEDRSPAMVAQDNSSTNELLDAKDNIEKDPSKTEEDVEHISKKNETREKVDQFLSKTEDKTEAFSSNADKIPQLMEEGTSQNEEAARSEEETEQNSETNDNKIEVEKELKVVAETSDASKSKESIALEPKSETDKIVNGDDIKNKVSEELSEDSKDTVKEEDTKKQNIVEARNTLPEHIGEQAFQSSAEEGTQEETPKIKGHEITQTVKKSEDTGRQDIQEGGVTERNIEALVREIDEEDSLRDENKDKEQAEEVDDSSLAFIENVEATSSDKETVSETLKDRAEPIVTSHHLNVTKASKEEKHPKEIKEELLEKSISLPEAFHEDSKEEIRSKEETSLDHSDSVSETMIKEEAGLQETEAEDTNQVESFGLVSEEKGVVETETRQIMLDGRDTKVIPEDTSNLSEMMDKDNPEVAGEDRIDKEQQNQVPHAVNEDQEEVATNTTPLKETLEEELNKRSTMASAEHKLESREASETVDETPEDIQAPDENKGTTFVTQAMDETLMQKHDNTNPLDVSESRSIETEKETAYEAQKHKVDDLYVHPELENEKDLSILEDVKILKGGEIGGLTDQTLQDAESSDLRLKIEETKDGKPFDEALKSTETSSVHTTVENAIIEQEKISKGNFHEGVKVEKAAIEQKEEAYCQGHEDTSTKDDGTLTEENFESVDPDRKFEFASEPVVEDQNKQIFPESDNSKIEESNKKKQQDETEVKEEEEPTLTAEENKEPNANDITKAVISTKKATGGEQLDDIEDIKEAVVEKEQGKNELHALSTVGETTNQVKDSTLACSDDIVAKSKEKTDTEILEFEEDSTRQREASFARQSEEQKPQDASIETLAEELEETKKEKILEESEDYCSKNDNAATAIVTAEKSSEQAEQEDKLFKASNIGPPCLETSETENSHQSKAIDITRLEETSCDLISNLPTAHDSQAEQESITVETTEASECEETKIASEAFYETKDQGTEETDIGTTVEKKDQVPSLDHDHAEKEYATLENSDKIEVDKIKIASAADQITEGTSEIGKSPTVERMDQVQSSSPEQEEIESTAVENIKANEVYESKVSSDADYMSQHQGTGESAGKTSTVEILDQVSISNSEHARNESVTEENPDADATKMASNVVFKSEDKDTKDNDDIRKSPTAQKQDVYKIEEASKVASNYRVHGDKSVSEDEITTDRTVSTEKLEEQLPALTSAITTTIEKVEEEKTKVVDMLEGEGPEDSSVAKPTEVICLQKEVSRELDFSTLGLKLNKDTQECPTEVHEEEGQNPDAALQLKPEENNNKIECGESPSESNNTTDLTGQTETGADLEFETSEKTIESEMVRHNHGLSESEDSESKEKHLVAAITDMKTEEKQLKQTSEANEITQNEVSNREITQEKEAAKTHRAVSLGKETMNLSLQENELKAEESVAEKTNTININSANPIQNEELSASTASKKIEEQVATDNRSVQDPEQVSVVNKTAKKTFPNEFETKDAKDAAIKLAPINQGEETNFGSGKTETLTPRDEELGTEISRKESIKEPAHGSNLIQDIQESENTCVTTVKQIPTEADLIDSPKTVVSTGNEYVPSGLQEGITEVGGIEPGKVHPETKGIKLEEEKTAGDSEEETVKEPVKMDTDKTSLPALLQTSSKETPQVAEHVTKESEPIASSEEIRTEVAENIQIREGKTGEEKDEEEEGDEHKKTDSSSNSPVIVDVTRDMDVKVAHKKSHGILSGVGSKVKHSISKVKKAITGKSSHHHPKPVSPK